MRATTTVQMYLIVLIGTSILGATALIATTPDDWGGSRTPLMLLLLLAAWGLSFTGLILEGVGGLKALVAARRAKRDAAVQATRDALDAEYEAWLVRNGVTCPAAALNEDAGWDEFYAGQDRELNELERRATAHADMHEVEEAHYRAHCASIGRTPLPSTITVQGPLITGAYIVDGSDTLAYIVSADEYESYRAFTAVRDRLAELDLDCNHD